MMDQKKNKKFKKNIGKKLVVNKKKVPAYIAPKTMRAGAQYEFKMPKAMYEDLFKEFKKTSKGNPYEAIVDYVNEDMGFLGTCVRVYCGD